VLQVQLALTELLPPFPLAPFQQEPLGPLQASVTVELQQQQSLTSPSQEVPLVRQAPLVQQVKALLLADRLVSFCKKQAARTMTPPGLTPQETTALTDVKVEKQQLF
jgi:hypothetical protein